MEEQLDVWERLEKALIEFVEDYSKNATTAAEVEALAAVSQVLMPLLKTYRHLDERMYTCFSVDGKRVRKGGKENAESTKKL